MYYQHINNIKFLYLNSFFLYIEQKTEGDALFFYGCDIMFISNFGEKMDIKLANTNKYLSYGMFYVPNNYIKDLLKNIKSIAKFKEEEVGAFEKIAEEFSQKMDYYQNNHKLVPNGFKLEPYKSSWNPEWTIPSSLEELTEIVNDIEPTAKEFYKKLKKFKGVVETEATNTRLKRDAWHQANRNYSYHSSTRVQCPYSETPEEGIVNTKAIFSMSFWDDLKKHIAKNELESSAPKSEQEFSAFVVYLDKGWFAEKNRTNSALIGNATMFENEDIASKRMRVLGYSSYTVIKIDAKIDVRKIEYNGKSTPPEKVQKLLAEGERAFLNQSVEGEKQKQKTKTL